MSGVFGMEAPFGVAPPSHREFQLFQQLIRKEAGIHLTDAKKDLLVARLRKRICELGLRSFRAYYTVVTSDQGERTRLVDRLTTNETRFFREAPQIEYLSQTVLPGLRRQAQEGARPRSVRAWSAGCSTGEEPYTLAMLLLQQLPPAQGWDLQILASDISTRVLEKAERGCYPMERKPEIPETALRAFMLRGVRSQAGTMTVAPAVRGLVRFSRLNLCEDPYPAGLFDLVLCRNVLIYFDTPTREHVIRRLADRLAADGLLLVGHAESLSAWTHGLHNVGPLTYARGGTRER